RWLMKLLIRLALRFKSESRTPTLYWRRRISLAFRCPRWTFIAIGSWARSRMATAIKIKRFSRESKREHAGWNEITVGVVTWISAKASVTLRIRRWFTRAITGMRYGTVLRLTFQK